MKNIFFVFVFLNLYQSYVYCAQKELQLFFPSHDLRVCDGKKREESEVNSLKDSRLELLGTTVYAIKENKRAKDFYTQALVAEINEDFHKADRLALEGYKTILKAQPGGCLLHDESSLVFNLWNLLCCSSLSGNSITLIKRALWIEIKRNIAIKNGITIKDFSLWEQIEKEYQVYLLEDNELSSKEKACFFYMGKIIEESKKRINYASGLALEIMEYKGQQDEANESVYNCSLCNSFFNYPGRVISLKNIGYNKLFDSIEETVRSKYLLKNYSSKSDKYMDSNGQMSMFFDRKYVRKKGFLIFSQIPEICSEVLAITPSFLNDSEYKIYVVSGCDKYGNSVQCLVFPEYELLFYQIESYYEIELAEEMQKASGNDLDATSAISLPSVRPLPTWRILNEQRKV